MPCVVTTLYRLQEVLTHKWWFVGPKDTTDDVTQSAPISSSFIIPAHFRSQCSLPVLSYSASQLSALLTQDNVTSSVTSPILKRLQNKGLVCYNDDQISHGFCEECEKENHGNDKDDGDRGCFSVVITITVSARADMMEKPKKLQYVHV